MGPVSNLTVILINSTTVLISWSPPFTLEGVPILGYNVTITNSSNINETFYVAESATMLYYLIDMSANIYVVCVVPVNFGGAGLAATYTFCDGKQNYYFYQKCIVRQLLILFIIPHVS